MNKKDDIRLNVTILASVALLSIIYDIAENKYYKFSIPTGLLMLGSAIAVSGLFYLLFRKTFAEICTIKTTCIALGVSAILSMFLSFSLYGILLLSEIYERPIAYRLNSLLWFLSLAALSWLIYLYKRARIKTNKSSSKGVLLDILTVVMFAVPFFHLEGFLLGEIESWLIGLKRSMIG